jgi:hypothetical protein
MGVQRLMGGTNASKRFCFPCNRFPCSSDRRPRSSPYWQLPRYLLFRGSFTGYMEVKAIPLQDRILEKVKIWITALGNYSFRWFPPASFLWATMYMADTWPTGTFYLRTGGIIYSDITHASQKSHINPLNAQLNSICHLLALFGAHHILHVS